MVLINAPNGNVTPSGSPVNRSLSMTPSPQASPTWNATTKIIITTLILLLALTAFYILRRLLLPLTLALVVAYIVKPAVTWLTRRTRLGHTWVTGLVYLLILAGLIAIPATAIPALLDQVGNFVSNLPGLLQQINDFLSRPIHIGNYVLPLEVQSPLLEQLLNNVVQLAQSLGTDSIALLGRVTGATLSTVGWILVVLFVSFYIVKDNRDFYNAILALVPDDHRGDAINLFHAMTGIWNAFLRGQIVLCLVVGMVVFILAAIIGLPNPLVLGLIAGLLEIVPNLGPVLAAVPAGLIALFQYNLSWLGALVGPFWFVVLVLAIYTVVQQVENYILVPRIMGYQLKIHPVIVFIGALAGASLAGILGIFLASPTLATLRLLGRYIYSKLTDQPPFALATVSLPPEASLPVMAAGGEGREEGNASVGGV